MTFKFTDKLLVPPGGTMLQKTSSAPPTTVPIGIGSRCEGMYKSIDSVTGGFFRPGIFRVNPVTILTLNSHVSAGSFNVYNNAYDWVDVKGPWIGYSGIIFGTFDTCPWHQSSCDNALIRAFAKMNNAGIQLGVVLAELKETLLMLHSPLATLYKYLKSPNAFAASVRQSALAKGSNVRTLKKLLDGYLTYRYGFRPLFYDISDAVKLLKEGFRKTSGLQRVAAKYTTSSSSSQRLAEKAWSGLYFTPQVDTRITYNTTASVYFRFTASSLSMLEDLGLSPWDLPSIVWELIPLSFAADWFLHLSSWLSAIRPSFSVTYVGNSVSQKTVMDTTTSPTSIRPFPGYKLSNYSDSTYKWTETKLVRRVNQALPPLPAVDLDYRNITHVIDSCALLAQRIHKRLR